MKNMKTKILVTVTLAAMIAACGPQGVQKQTSLNNSNGNHSGQDSGGGADNGGGTNSWQQMKTEVDSTAVGGQYDGMLMITLDPARQTLNLILPLPPILVMPLSLVAFKELPGTTIQSETQPDGKEAWVIAIPLKYVLKGANLNPTLTLPNGNPLPYVPAGEITGFSVSLPQNPKHRITVYIGLGYAAAFIETPDWEIPSWLAPWAVIKNRSKTKQIGFIQLVPNKGTFSSGVFVAARLPNDITRILGTIVQF